MEEKPQLEVQQKERETTNVMKYLDEVSKPNIEGGESAVYRSSLVREQGRVLLEDPKIKANTMYELISHCIETFGDREVLGYREVLEIFKEEVVTGNPPQTKVFTFPKLSPYKWINYNQLSEMLTNLSSAFHHIGLKPQEKVTFYAPSTHQWLILAYALFYQSVVVATVYDTLGEEGLLHGMNQTESRVVYLTADQLPILKNIQENATHLTTVIYTGTLPDSVNLTMTYPKLQFYSWDELMELGKANPSPPTPPKPEDLAVIMYTSGSTGPPKGALLGHAQITSHIAGIGMLTTEMVLPSDVIISFLPLAHILAFTLNTYGISIGCKMGFATPRTLLDSSVRECRGDLCELRPTALPGVPQVFDSIRKGVLNKIASAGAVKKTVFNTAVSFKRFLVSIKLPTAWLDRIVFKPLTDVTGGRIRMGVCGGAPLSKEVAGFFETTLFPIYQGYGMTEMCGLGSLVHCNSDMNRSSVGQLNPTMELKLVDVPDAGYFSKNMVGELWVRGSCVTDGYFKNPTATEEAKAEGGWLRTGDIVRLDKQGCISIIDRRKNLVKLANGEYIAIEKLESIYRNSLYVQTICIMADSYLRQPVAIIQVNLPALKHFATKAEIPFPSDISQINDDPRFTTEVLTSCLTEAKKASLNSSERLANIYLAPLEFSVENNCLTPSQKLNRRAVQSTFQSEITKLFQSAK